MLVNINIKLTKRIKQNNKSRSQRTYFLINNVYLEHLLSLGFSLKNFAFHKAAMLKKNFV
jgi:hypothetical protein